MTRPASEPEVWFDGDYSECWYGIGPLTKGVFAAIVNSDPMMEGEDPCYPADVVDTLAKSAGDSEGRFYLRGQKSYEKCQAEPYPILMWRPM